jgi:hypothetical protein
MEPLSFQILLMKNLYFYLFDLSIWKYFFEFAAKKISVCIDFIIAKKM